LRVEDCANSLLLSGVNSECKFWADMYKNILGTFMFAFLFEVEIESKKGVFMNCVPEKWIIKYIANPTNIVIILLISQGLQQFVCR
jgi:hypothetical protein